MRERMRWRSLLLTIAALGVSGLIAWGVSTATSQEPVPPDISDANGRLSRYILPLGQEGREGDLKVCYYDADVRFQDGNVGVVESIGDIAKDSIRLGDPIADLPPDMETGRTIPIPVHIGADGRIHPGYLTCDEVSG